MSLIDYLVTQLGISSEQASQGAGALLKLAERHVSAATFAALCTEMGNAEALLANAPPASRGMGSLLGGLVGGKLGEFAQLVGQFQSAGMDTAQLSQFSKLALEWLQPRLPPAAADEIQRLLKSNLG